MTTSTSKVTTVEVVHLPMRRGIIVPCPKAGSPSSIRRTRGHFGSIQRRTLHDRSGLTPWTILPTSKLNDPKLQLTPHLLDHHHHHLLQPHRTRSTIETTVLMVNNNNNNNTVNNMVNQFNMLNKVMVKLPPSPLLPLTEFHHHKRREDWEVCSPSFRGDLRRNNNNNRGTILNKVMRNNRVIILNNREGIWVVKEGGWAVVA